MGIALLDADPSGRSKLASIAFAAIGLAFFFGVGLAGGAAYKIYFGDASGPQVADQASPPPPAPAAPAEPNFAATPSSAAEKAAPDAAPMEASAPPALEPPTAPPPAEATESATMVQAAAPPAPAAPEPALQAAAEPPAGPQAAPDAAVAPPQPDAPAALQAAAPPPAAVIPLKPTTPAKAHPAPQTAAMHPPPAAHGSAAGAFRVQFGAFANEDNARHLQSALAAAGLKVAVSHDQGPSGKPLFFVRSQSYPDRAAALGAAQNVQNRARLSANPTRIDYTIIPDHAAGEQHAQR